MSYSTGSTRTLTFLPHNFSIIGLSDCGNTIMYLLPDLTILVSISITSLAILTLSSQVACGHSDFWVVASSVHQLSNYSSSYIWFPQLFGKLNKLV